MYTAKPPRPDPALAIGINCATLRRPLWTIPEADRMQMHAFTRPSTHLRDKVRDALLRSLHHTSFYRRLFIANRRRGARIYIVGRSIYIRFTSNPKEGTIFLKFIYDQLYNGKLVQRYGHAPSDECPLCHKPDSCTHFAGESPDHETPRISRNNAAC